MGSIRRAGLMVDGRLSRLGQSTIGSECLLIAAAHLLLSALANNGGVTGGFTGGCCTGSRLWWRNCWWSCSLRLRCNTPIAKLASKFVNPMVTVNGKAAYNGYIIPGGWGKENRSVERIS